MVATPPIPCYTVDMEHDIWGYPTEGDTYHLEDGRPYTLRRPTNLTVGDTIAYDSEDGTTDEWPIVTITHDNGLIWITGFDEPARGRLPLVPRDLIPILLTPKVAA